MTCSEEISSVCEQIKNLLISKNLSYGDSALDPIRVFSKSDSLEQILVRIDDKLSRIQRGAGLIANDEDVVDDLIGYLVLLKIALRSKPESENQEFKREFLSFPSGNDVLSFANELGSRNRLDMWDGTDINPPFNQYYNNMSPFASHLE